MSKGPATFNVELAAFTQVAVPLPPVIPVAALVLVTVPLLVTVIPVAILTGPAIERLAVALNDFAPVVMVNVPVLLIVPVPSIVVPDPLRVMVAVPEIVPVTTKFPTTVVELAPGAKIPDETVKFPEILVAASKETVLLPAIPVLETVRFAGVF